MSSENVMRQLGSKQGHKLPFHIGDASGGTIGTTGHPIVVCSTLPTALIYPKGALAIVLGNAADTNLYVNEGDGYGSALSWVVLPTP